VPKVRIAPGTKQLEPHAVDRHGRLGRHVDAWRPVLHYSEEMVWAILERHRVVAPVPYRLGWSRSSCLTCVFDSPAFWATISKYMPSRAKPIAQYETEYGSTISRQRINVLDLGATAEAFQITDMEALAQAEQREYRLPIFTLRVSAGSCQLEPSTQRGVVPSESIRFEEPSLHLHFPLFPRMRGKGGNCSRESRQTHDQRKHTHLKTLSECCFARGVVPE
jgi:hypothetical protein